MTGFLRLGSRTNNPAHADFALRIQSSLQGRPKAIGAGQNRLTGNVPWTGDFSASPAKSGGKGGSGSTGKGSTGTYNYSSSFILSLGDGPIVGVQSIINGNAIDFLVTPPASVLADLEALGISPTYGNIYGATFILGSYTQAPWSFLTSNHPTQALAYRGEALACFANFGLGNSASLPNFSFEILWGINSDIPALGPDANPADWITAALTNADWGVGFPTTLLDGLTDYRTWCRALSMMISPVLTGQTALQSHLSDLMTGTAADFVWSGGKLTIAPYADQTVSGNGYTYVPVVTPIYDLTTGDFLVNQGSLGNESGDTPIASSRKDPQLVPNRLPLEYLDRSNLYNPVTIYESDDVSIVASNRLRAADLRSHHFFCLAAAASSSAALQMQREKVQTTYQFTLPAQFIRLEPVKDIVTLTDPYLGLNRQPVRITEKTENSDRSLTFVAEEFLGYAAPPLYARQKSLGSARNINVEPGLLNPPILFEPPDQLAGALEIWAAVSGQNTALWGGCKVWVSYDPAGTFIEVADVASPARMGVLTASLPSISANLAGQTIDNTNTLAVSLAESAGALASGSTIDMTGLTTVCFVDGEIIAYQTATLTGANAYSLAPLVRGAYASTIATHAAASSFARLDDAIGKVRFTQDRIGSTIYLKFQSYNIYGGGVQDLSTLASYSYAITGAALASPLPTPTNLRTVFSSGVTHLYWDEVSDFRQIAYEIRKGSAWTSGLKVTTQAHPPFVVVGDDTYWVAAVSQPASGLIVYSASQPSIAISGSLLSQNLVAGYDEQATGWTGTLSSGAISSGANIALNGTVFTGTYEISPSHWVNIGYVASCLCGASYVGIGVPSDQNVLTATDFLGIADMLGSASTQFVDVHVEIAIAQSAPNVFATADIFSSGLPGNDIFGAGIVWSAWQKFIPGVYSGMLFKFRVVLTTLSLKAIPYCLGFSFQVTVPSRSDHYTQLSVPSTGLTITFRPDGASSAGAFNGGPNGATLPLVDVSYQPQTGDTYQVTGLSASQATISFFNSSGAAVARTADVIAYGY